MTVAVEMGLPTDIIDNGRKVPCIRIDGTICQNQVLVEDNILRQFVVLALFVLVQHLGKLTGIMDEEGISQ